MSTPLQFLALGDSYTIGESVNFAQCWPLQLNRALRGCGFDLAEPHIIARTGWTTGNLLAALAQAAPLGKFDFVSLLIGVNNQYQGLDAEAYHQEFRALLERAIGFVNGQPSQVLVLSIPDWGVTPFAQSYDSARIGTQIDHFNAINLAESQAAGAGYLDITPISRQAAADFSLLAADGLHPSGKMYAAWVAKILPLAREMLKRKDRT